MSVSRIKGIVIAALLLINVFFLVIIIIDTHNQTTSERLALENVCAVLRSNGIEIDPESINTANAFRTMRTARGEEIEEAIAGVFLGQAELTDLGAVYLYENSEKGNARFYSAGDFEIQLNEGVITNAYGTLRTVRELLREMGLETLSVEMRAQPDAETVAVVGAYKNVKIFNCTINFVFDGGSLRTVTGRYVTGVEPAEESVEISYVGTALLGFLSAVKKGEIECNEIHSVEAVYMHSVVGSFGEGVISPAWLVTTGEGMLYCIDSETGDIRQLM